MGLLDIRDELADARDYVGCLYLACRNIQIDSEREALCAVSHAVREKLNAIDAAIAKLISDPNSSPDIRDRG